VNALSASAGASEKMGARVGSRGNQPKYGAPYTPPPGDDQPNPDEGKDLWGLVPQLGVPEPWNTSPPSFNDEPPGPKPSSGDSPPATPETWPIQISMTSVRAGLDTLMAETKSAVAQYQDMRNTVYANKDHVFGQDATVLPEAYGLEYADPGTDPEPSDIQPSAQKFAANINPAQERVLEQIANTLEVCGQFIAGVDRSGQAYGSADRKAKFPAPPPNPVTKA
jgi:hypothetical protein